MRMVDQAHCVVHQVSQGPRVTRAIAVSQALLVCKAPVELRAKMVPTESLDLVVLLAPRVTRVLLVLVAPLETLDLAVRRETKETLAPLDFPAPLVTRVPRVSTEMSVPVARLVSAVLSAPRVTQVRLVRLVAWA